MNVLHIVPETVLANEHQGAYKDVLSRTRWLQAHAGSYQQRAVATDDPAVADGWPLEPVPTHILLEYSHFPRLLGRLKAACPRAKVLVRTHNIEPLQHLDNCGWRPPRGTLWLLYGLGQLLRQDLACARKAEAILSINEWENGVYWKWLAGRARVEWLPYVCPEPLISRQPMPYEMRTIIACLPTSKKNRKSLDLVVRFCELARQMKKLGGPEEFVVTGRLEGWGLPACPEVTFAGFIDDLPDFLGRCRAVALPSPLGYGFKTTLGDAFAAGAHALVHPRLVQRSPAMIRPYLISVDSACRSSLRAAAEQLQVLPRGAELHSRLRARFDETMQRWFTS